jgi:uncharacterized protein (TIGR03083 family)
MHTLSFGEALTLIDDRSSALRSAVTSAGLSARVPGCPDWTAQDLVAHLGAVHLFWAAAVAAGPAEGPPSDAAVGDQAPHGDLMEWSASATGKLVAALHEAGPDRSCWTWWESAGAPNNAGAVARHQAQEAGVHAFDAEQAAGHTWPLPDAVAADGVGEFLTVELPTNGPWPYDPATVIVEAGAGGKWLIDLEPEGARILQGDEHGGVKPWVTVTGQPSDLVLAFYRRDHGDLHFDGDADIFARLINWPNLD